MGKETQASLAEVKAIASKARADGYLIGRNTELLRFTHGKFTLYADPKRAREVVLWNDTTPETYTYISYLTKKEMAEGFDNLLRFYREQLICELGSAEKADAKLKTREELDYIKNTLAKGF